MKPYKEQLDAVNIALKKHQGAIIMPTGVGKSVTMALLFYKLQVRTLIVVPNLALKQQLSNSFETWFGKLPKDLIRIENIDSNELKKAKDYDCLIIDEAHRSAASTYRKLNKTAWTGIYYRYFFTATFHRGREEEQLLMESITGQIIYKLDYHQAVENKRIVPMEAFYVQLPKTPASGFRWAEVYSELVVNNKVRNKVIQELLIAFNRHKKSTLCLVKEIKHGELIASDGAFHFANGLNEDTKDLIKAFNSKSLITLIGTNGIIGEGVDTKPAEFVIIAGLGKSKNAFMQQCGRGFRVYPGKDTCKIIIFKDDSHKFTKSHFKAQCKYLEEEYGIKPTLLFTAGNGNNEFTK